MTDQQQGKGAKAGVGEQAGAQQEATQQAGAPVRRNAQSNVQNNAQSDAQGSAAAGQATPATGDASARQQGRIKEGTAILVPPVDVIEDAGGITLLADLPGVSRDGLQVHLDADSLTIEGEVTLDLPPQMESRYAEIKHQYYQRTFALSRELDPEQANAELNHGVLKLRIPKAQHAQPRKIQINVA